MEGDGPVLTDDHQKLLDKAEDVRLRALLGIIALEGQTPGQALSLLRKDVKVAGYPPRIHMRMAYHASSDEIPRTIEIDPRLEDYLRDLLQVAHLPEDAPLFVGPGGKRLSTRWAQRELEVLRQSLGLDPIKLRDLRREAIRWMDEKTGMSTPEIAKHLGLRDGAFTRSVYPSAHPRRRNPPARSQNSVDVKDAIGGRPRKNMERDAELVRMMDEPDATQGTVARAYNKRHPAEEELKPQTVKRAIKRHLEFLAREAKS